MADEKKQEIDVNLSLPELSTEWDWLYLPTPQFMIILFLKSIKVLALVGGVAAGFFLLHRFRQFLMGIPDYS